MDGGVVDNIPIDVARAKGADLVVAVDISEDVGNVNIKNIVDVLLQSTNIMFAVNVANRKAAADVVVAAEGRRRRDARLLPEEAVHGRGHRGRARRGAEIRAAIEAWKAKKAVELAPRG